MPSILNVCLALMAPMLAAASSHHNSRRYDAYNYDMGVCEYTPDGRLLQVEYATNACIRDDSNPIVSVGVSSVPRDADDMGDTFLIMATISSLPQSSSSTSTSLATTTISNPAQNQNNIQESTQDGEQSDDDKVINSLMHERHQRTQYRIIEVPLSTSHHTAHTSTILIGLTGLLSDATSLLDIVYSRLEQEQLKFGWHRLGLSPVGVREIVDQTTGSSITHDTSQPSSLSKQSQSISTQPSETVLRLSRAIADECQKHALGGGVRPFGASLLLAGVDSNFGNTKTSNTEDYTRRSTRVAMSETHPNGGWRSRVSSTDESKDSSVIHPQIMVSGGPIKSQHRLKSLLNSRLRGIYQQPFGIINPSQNKEDIGEALFLRRALQAVISSLVEEWKSRGDASPSSLESSSTQQQPVLPHMEVVVSSTERGTFRLTETDIARVLKPS